MIVNTDKLQAILDQSKNANERITGDNQQIEVILSEKVLGLQLDEKNVF